MVARSAARGQHPLWMAMNRELRKLRQCFRSVRCAGGSEVAGLEVVMRRRVERMYSSSVRKETVLLVMLCLDRGGASVRRGVARRTPCHSGANIYEEWFRVRKPFLFRGRPSPPAGKRVDVHLVGAGDDHCGLPQQRDSVSVFLFRSANHLERLGMMVTFLLGCASQPPMRGEYEFVGGSQQVDSCLTGMPWYGLRGGEIREMWVAEVDPGVQFSLRFVLEYGDDATLPCMLDDDAFECGLEVGTMTFDDSAYTYIDQLLVEGVWSADSHADLWWTLVRTCEREEAWCDKHREYNCGLAARLELEPIP